MAARRVHLIGIGGVGMAGLAVLLKSRGDEVSGCDLQASPRLEWLRAQGIAVALGHDPAHLVDVDEVIVTPAVPQDSPERRSAAKVCFRGEVLAAIVSAHPDAIAVCGSHGKTTTATWIARLLKALGEDPSWCIGGETGAFPVAGVGQGPLVVEADESDGTLALYHARTLVVNRCDYDHPDHFKSEADYLACYATAKRQAGQIVESEELALDDAFAELPLHNRRNAQAAVEVALRRGHERGAILAALRPLLAELPDRRFQPLAPGVYTDYAHHPAEITCALEMARRQCTGVLRVLFQPHRFSRTKALRAEFAQALAGADEVVLCPTYAAFEQPVEGGDTADLYQELRERSVLRNRVLLARTCEEAWDHACLAFKPGDLTLLLGAGDIVNLAPQVRKGEPFAREGDHYLGAGTNTWQSDLLHTYRYIRSQGPVAAPGSSLGIPWMAGIPGTIGGWIKMNAGAFGHSFSEVLAAVKVDGRWLAASDCGFGYRQSAITGEIQDYRLNESYARIVASTPTAEEYRARRKHFPAGTKGSVFKNPPGDFAGRLLEAANCKGLRVGGAFVWEEHANVIVAGPDANSSDFLALARLMRNRVFFCFGIRLEAEVKGLLF